MRRILFLALFLSCLRIESANQTSTEVDFTKGMSNKKFIVYIYDPQESTSKEEVWIVNPLSLDIVNKRIFTDIKNGLNLDRRQAEVYKLFLYFLHEIAVDLDKKDWDRVKEIWPVIEEYRAYSALPALAISMKEMKSQEKNFFEDIKKISEYLYRWLAINTEETDEDKRMINNKSLMKLEKVLTNIIHPHTENIGEFLLNLSKHREIPIKLMIQCLKKPVITDSEDSFLYAIILMTLGLSDEQRINEEDLIKLLSTCDFTKLSCFYLSHTAKNLIEKYKNKGYSSAVKSFINKRIILAMETSVGGLDWLKKCKPEEFAQLKNRVPKKGEVCFNFDYTDALKGIISSKLINRGFTWLCQLEIRNGALIISIKKFIIEGEKDWITDSKYLPVKNINLVLSSNKASIKPTTELMGEENNKQEDVIDGEKINKYHKDISAIKFDKIEVYVNLEEKKL